jgi:Carboxypeptidase regulatory-like domain
MQIMFNVKRILFVLCLLLTVNIVFAQETTSEINGIVTDEGSKGLAGATIKALHIPTGTSYTTTTRKDGRYNLPNLKVGGPYTITVSFVGYAEDRKEEVYLNLGEEYKASFSLKPSSRNLDNVIITSTRNDRTFNSNRTGAQETINRSQIERLPTINRSLQDFTKLTPSANGLSFGGRSGSYNNVTVDGANFNNAFGLSSTLGGQTSSQPISLDAIEQIQVSISPYDVRQGGFSGAGINSVTRSGTNQFKGSIYTYIRTPELQGYKVRTNTITKPSFDYNLRGASVGGAIIKNKLFFFVSGEQERVSEPATTIRALKPGETAIPGVISQAPADSLNKLKNFLVSKYGYNPGEFDGYNYRTQSDKLTVRLDWNISPKNKLTLKYNYLKSFRDIPASNSGAPNNNRQPGDFGLPFSGSGYTINNNFNIVIAELNTKFSNSMNNKLQVGFTALRDFRASLAGADFPLVDILNPATSRTLTSFGYEPFTYNNKLNSDIFQFSDIFTFYAGKHEITVGTQNFIKKFTNGFAPNYQGIYTFQSLNDFFNSANFGTPNASNYIIQYSLKADGSFPFAKVGAKEFGFFAQDKYRVTNNLTVTYGLRIDLPTFDNSFESNPNVPNLTFRDGKKYDAGAKPGNNLLVSPRFGFNWDAFNNKTTQVRGGAGLFAGPPPFVWVSNQASNNGVQFGSFTATNVAFSNDVNKYRPAVGAPNTAYNLVFTDKGFKYPQVLKTGIAVDQKLPHGIIATVEFTYSKDINSVYFQNVNLPSTGTAFAGSDGRIRYSGTKIYSGAGGASVTNPNITNAILMKNSNKGYSYNLTAQVQKSSPRVYASVAYTYSNAKSLNDGGSIAASMWRDRPVKGDPNAEDLGFANFYLPHRFIGQASYKINYGKNYATSVGLIYEAAPAGVGSYTYAGDVNNDGTGGNNDLIYVPKDQNDIVLVPVNTGGGTITDTRSASIIWNQLNNFINQDPYLSTKRGQVVDRNAAILPFFKKLDLNITQDFYVQSGKNRNTIRLTFDIINVGNLLNKNWGIAKTFNNLSFLRYEGLVTAAGPNLGKPRYSFVYQDASNQIPLVNSYRDNTSIFSRWQGQLGIRYIFN